MDRARFSNENNGAMNLLHNSRRLCSRPARHYVYSSHIFNMSGPGLQMTWSRRSDHKSGDQLQRIRPVIVQSMYEMGHKMQATKKTTWSLRDKLNKTPKFPKSYHMHSMLSGI